MKNYRITNKKSIIYDMWLADLLILFVGKLPCKKTEARLNFTKAYKSRDKTND